MRCRLVSPLVRGLAMPPPSFGLPAVLGARPTSSQGAATVRCSREPRPRWTAALVLAPPHAATCCHMLPPQVIEVLSTMRQRLEALNGPDVPRI